MDDRWHKIIFDTNPEMSGDLAKIRLLAQYCDESANKPKDFAVFNGMEFPESKHTPTSVIYFSPVAAPLCASDIQRAKLTSQVCDPPGRNDAGLRLLYSTKPDEAWALLK